MTMRTWNWLTHLVWDMRNAVHVGMCTMVWNGQLIIIFDVVISQVIIWIHAAFLLQPLTLHRHAAAAQAHPQLSCDCICMLGPAL